MVKQSPPDYTKLNKSKGPTGVSTSRPTTAVLVVLSISLLGTYLPQLTQVPAYVLRVLKYEAVAFPLPKTKIPQHEVASLGALSISTSYPFNLMVATPSLILIAKNLPPTPTNYLSSIMAAIEDFDLQDSANVEKTPGNCYIMGETNLLPNI